MKHDNYRSERHERLDNNHPSCSSCVKCPVPQACEVSLWRKGEMKRIHFSVLALACYALGITAGTGAGARTRP